MASSGNMLEQRAGCLESRIGDIEKKFEEFVALEAKIKELEQKRWTCKIFAQRVESAKLMVDMEQDVWQSMKRGIIVYISFRKGCNDKKVDKAATTILNLDFMSLGAWGDENGTKSMLHFLREKYELGIMIIPQAALSCKIKDNGRGRSSEDQCEKAEAKRLYEKFIESIRIRVRNAIYPEAEAKEKEAANRAKRARGVTPPDQYFRTGDFEGKFQSFDESGLPLTDQNGKELSKKRKKKFARLLKQQEGKYQKFLESDRKTEQVMEVEKVAEDYKLPPIISGTFGGRQGLELKAGCGPFSHTFTV